MSKTHLSAIFILLALTFSCKKNNLTQNEYEGISICASEAFSYIEDLKVNGSTTPADVDFTAAPYAVNVTAVLSENVSWVVKVTGEVSGAIKTFTGTSATVNVNWYGNSESNSYFIDGENCRVSIQPSCREEVSVNIKIANASTFDKYGYLLFDFDIINGGGSVNSEVIEENVSSPNPSPQGGYYHRMYAAQGVSGWYIGYYGRDCVLSAFAAGLSNDEVYVNVYLKGNPHTVATIQLVEKVAGKNYPFKKSFKTDWTGWKMVSYKMSDLSIGVPANVNNVSISVGPDVLNGETECFIDFAILTKGHPFNAPN